MLPDHSVGEATYLARPPSSFPASKLGIIGTNKPDTLFHTSFPTFQQFIRFDPFFLENAKSVSHSFKHSCE